MVNLNEKVMYIRVANTRVDNLEAQCSGGGQESSAEEPNSAGNAVDTEEASTMTLVECEALLQEKVLYIEAVNSRISELESGC